MGRVDDMIWYRGVNFFPSAVEDIVRGFSELSPEYQIRIGEERSLPTITIVVESDRDQRQLEQRVASRIKDGIGISPRVEVAAVGALPRNTDGGKLRRVVDTRKSKVTGGMI
jgi:phenylacetate-CoA ligase